MEKAAYPAVTRYRINSSGGWRTFISSDKDWEKDFQRVHAMISEVEAFREARPVGPDPTGSPGTGCPAAGIE